MWGNKRFSVSVGFFLGFNSSVCVVGGWACAEFLMVILLGEIWWNF